MKIHEVTEIEKRVMFLRDPIERLISCYCFLKTLREENTSYDNFNFKYVDSWQTFVDFMLENRDTHWLPQSELMTLDGKFVPTEIVKFENINQWFSDIGIKLSKQNPSKKFLINLEYRKACLADYYHADIKLRESVK